MAEIYNLGTDGTALNAFTTGLTLVTGPAVWFPGTAGNDLTCTGFTIPSTAGILPLPFTDGALTITADDIANLQPDTPQFDASTGQTVSVNRTLTGAATVIAPDGTAVYVNTEPATATNQAVIPKVQDVAFDVAADDDVTIIWCGQTGNTPGVNAHMIRTGTANTNAMRLASNTGTELVAVFQDANAATFTRTVPNYTPNHQAVVYIATLDRTTGTLTARLYTKAGIVNESTLDASAAAGATNVGGAQILRNVPGTVSGFAWNTGPSTAPTGPECDAIAEWFLNNYPLPDGIVYLTDPTTPNTYLTDPATGLYLTRN